ncbi:hypothetical protein PRUPE_3G288500 [Prunus persica]|uniref:Uncharacterized protein n=1 Tax=Prunus persica TaxID=3760 RepID=A0A251Q778_PRUPE|nr:hypothetical protein PRUPE_3G288500 [Prunus persica]
MLTRVLGHETIVASTHADNFFEDDLMVALYLVTVFYQSPLIHIISSSEESEEPVSGWERATET